MECTKRCSLVVPGWIKVLLLLGIILSPSRAQEEGDVRLVGPTYFQGTVAVYHDGVWGSICDDSWNYADADVVCKQLGFERSNRIWYRAYYGEAPGPIWLDQMRCRSTDQTVSECKSNGWGLHDCKKREDAGVDCYRKEPERPKSLPIGVSCPKCVQGGSCTFCPRKSHPDPQDCSPQAAIQGIVFAYYNEKWSPITGEGWDMQDAHVACGEMGYPLALGIPSLEELWKNWNGDFLQGCVGGGGSGGQGSDLTDQKCGSDNGFCSEEEVTENNEFRESLKETLFTQMRCDGNEQVLNKCYYKDIGPFNRSSINVATVICGFKPHSNCSNIVDKEIYRTRGGPVPWMGRIEVNVDKKWGTICDREWSIEESNIVCRALGYGTAKQATYRANFGRGVLDIHYTRLRCTGFEDTLLECKDKETGIFALQCGHLGDAGVICNVPTMCPPDTEERLARIIELPNEHYPDFLNDSYVEVKGSLGWGLLCNPYLDIITANLICKSEKQLFANRVLLGKARDYTGGTVRYNGLIECSPEKESLEECGIVLVPTTRCEDDSHAVVECTNTLPDLVPDKERISLSLRSYPYIDRFPIYFLTCAREEGCLSSSSVNAGLNEVRALLRFDSLTMNWGTVDFLPNRARDQWQFHSCHNHFHSFEAFIHYDLLDAVTDEKVAEGHKASFCLEDSFCDGGSTRFRCSSGHQGISPNCGDLYGRHLDCQWIDITDVPLGSYTLRLIVNPDNLVLESDYRNNEVRCKLEIKPGFSFQFDEAGCSLSDH